MTRAQAVHSRGVAIAALVVLLGTKALGGGASPGADYNNDGRADLAVQDSQTGAWFIRSLSGGGPLAFGLLWGEQGDVTVPGDYDGDGHADQAYYMPKTGDWSIRSLAKDRTIVEDMNWGFEGCVPVAGDYNGDGRFDLAVYDTKSGKWFIRELGDGPPLAFGVTWGAAGCVPVSGDFNGDGRHDLAFRYQPSGQWYIRSVLPGAGSFIALGVAWGPTNQPPVSGDYDGDGADDLAVYNAKSGDWFIRSHQRGQTLVNGLNWGFADCVPVPGDYNVDGRYDLAVYHRPGGDWFIRSLQDGPPIVFAHNWGWSSGDAVGAIALSSGSNPVAPPPSPSPRTVPSDFSGVTWLHTDVSDWKQTAKLREVRVTSSRITLDYDKADVWPGRKSDPVVNANPWIFVPKEDGSGWYAATWEWMKVGQTTKNRSSVAGDHIKKSPLNDFKPVAGATYGFMVSGLARDSTRNVKERSNVVMVKWPSE